MKENRIDLLVPHLSGQEKLYVEKALIRNELAAFGENIDLFKEKLTNYFEDTCKLTLLNSGTSALHLGLIALGVEKGDEVICQSFTFCASAYPILYLGATPVFVDSEEDTWNICPEHLENAIKERMSKGKKPKALVIVNSYGMPAKWNEIKNISDKFAIPILEDAAEAIGSHYANQKCGTFGDIGILSFNSNKIITTTGGGALICKEDKVIQKVESLARQSKEEEIFYLHKRIGYNYTMSNLVAGIGCAQMEVLEERLGRKKEISNFYQNLFKEMDGYKLLSSDGSKYFSNNWLNCVLIDSTKTGFNNFELKDILHKNGIETRMLWNPMHNQPVFKNYPYFGNTISENLFKKGLCLPSSTSLTTSDLEMIAAVIKSAKT